MIADPRTVKAVQAFIHRNHAALSAVAREGHAGRGRGAVALSLDALAGGAADPAAATARYAAGDELPRGKDERQARGLADLVARYDAARAMVVAVVAADGEVTAYPISLAGS
jgi:hypothetical protein